MDGMAGLDRWIVEGPREAAGEYEAVGECGHTWFTQGQPDMGLVDLDETACPECGCGDIAELHRA